MHIKINLGAPFLFWRTYEMPFITNEKEGGSMVDLNQFWGNSKATMIIESLYYVC